MALDKTKKSNRLLQSKRYTMESSTDAQEAFTRTLDINAGDVYIREDFVPSTSGSLPYSGSAQNELTIQSASVDIVKYYYQFQLTPSNVVNGSKTEVFFFISKSGHDPTVAVTPQIIQDGQQTNFLSPKYSDAALTFKNTEDNVPAGDGTVGYNVTVRVNGTEQDAGFYQFDYKTGVLQFVNQSDAPTTGDTVVMSAYQYVGPTLAGNLGGGSGVGFPFTGSAQITGSLSVTGSSTFDISNSEEFKIDPLPVQDFPFMVTYATGSGKIGYVEISSGTSGIAGSNGTSGISGTSGTNGSNGESGGDGTSGSSGESGTSGSSGSDGSAGATGNNGQSAQSGTSGSSGTDGSTGAAGANGESANSGTSGSSGTDGSTGAAGANGESQASGTSGSSGTDGSTGAAGGNGQSALSGTSGSSGTTGSNGAAGGNGTSNQSGTSGSSGTDGSNGAAGAAGASASSNTSGTTGSSGSSGVGGAGGVSGGSGTAGSSGADGTSGSSGADGTSGTSGFPGGSGSTLQVTLNTTNTSNLLINNSQAAFTMNTDFNLSLSNNVLLGQGFSGQSGFIRFQTPTSNQTCNGLTVVQGDGSGVSQGMLVQYDGGIWYPADADTENRSTQMLGIAISDEVADDGVLVQGIAKTNYGVLSSASAGDILYVDETAGYYTNVRPTVDNDFVRIIGYLLDISDAENPVIYFDPDKTFIKLG